VRWGALLALALGGCDLGLDGFVYSCNASNACPPGSSCDAGVCFSSPSGSTGTTGTAASTSSSSSGTGTGSSASSTTTGGITLTQIAGRRNKSGFIDGPALGTAEFYYPSGLVYQAPLLYVADQENEAIREIDFSAGFEDGTVSTPAYALTDFPSGLVAGPPGTLLVSGSSVGELNLSLSDGGISSIASSSSSSLFGLAYDAAQSLIYVADHTSNCIEVINLANPSLAPFAGSCGSQGDYNDGPALGGAMFNGPWGLALDDAGALYVGDVNNFLIRVIRNGEVSTLAGNPTDAINGVTSSPPVDGEGLSAQFSAPRVLVLDSQGNLFVGDASNVRKVAPQPDGGYWVSTLYAPNASDELTSPVEIYGLALDEVGGNLFISSIPDQLIYLLQGF
jgi:NHL repeat